MATTTTPSPAKKTGRAATQKAGAKTETAKTDGASTTAPETPETPATPATPDVPTKTGAQLATEFEKAARAKLGKLEKVEKQNYYRLMKDGVAVAYVNASKRHARVNLSVEVSDSADVDEVVAFIERGVALRAKADAKS